MKIKFHILPIAITLAGLTFMFASFWKYWVSYPDVDRLIASYTTIGGIICILGYFYNWMKNKDLEDEDRNNRIDGILKIYGGEEFK